MYAMILTCNHAEAEHLVQEAYVRASQVINRLRPDRNLKQWLFKILRNIWLNHLRKERSAPQVLDLDIEDSVSDSTVEAFRNLHDVYAA
jgi:RNA polymerase sigma-70 factor, ECF subfamily